MIRTLEVQTSSKFTESALVWRGLAIIGVVVEHAIGWGFTAMFWWTDRYMPVTVPNFDQIGSITYYIYRAMETFFAFALPALFFVSGYFMQLTSQREKLLWSKIFTRIKRLAIPFVFWSLLMMLLNIIEDRNYTILTFVMAIITGSSASAFYFIPALIQLYLLSPFIINQMQQRPQWVLILTALIQLLSWSLSYGVILSTNTPTIKQLLLLNDGFFFTNHIFWFTLGIAIGFYLDKLVGLLERTKWWLLGLSVITLFLGIFEWEVLFTMSGEVWIARRITLVIQIYMFFSLFTLLAFREWKPPFAKQLTYLGSKSYGIYLVHSLILIFVARTIYHFAPTLLANQFLYQLVLVSMAIAIPLIMMGFTARISSGRYYALLFGRR